MVQLNNLNYEINLLSNIIGEYKNMPFTTEHINRWIEQFPQESQKIILQELISILSKTYCSKDSLLEYFVNSLLDESILPNGFQNHKFISPQTTGNSQKELLDILDDYTQECHGIAISECGIKNPVSYVYIDDALYSGRRLIEDMKLWDIENDQEEFSINFIFYAIHDRDLEYVKKEIIKLFPKATLIFTHSILFNNSNRYSETFSLSNEIQPDIGTDYIENIISKRTDKENQFFPILRPNNIPRIDNYFTTAENRKIVEQVFFEKGIEIINYAANPNPFMKPFGFDKKYTLGFGSYFVNYRNIANNCPLVLWWGDQDAKSGINNWYPLFSRKVNKPTQNVIFNLDDIFI